VAVVYGFWLLSVTPGCTWKRQHHRVVFVHGVVTVHGPITLEVAEAEEESCILIELKLRDILARHLHVGNTRKGGADAAAAAAKWAVGREN